MSAWKKTISFKQAKIELVTEQRKIYLTTTTSKIGPPHNYRANNYDKNKFSLF